MISVLFVCHGNICRSPMAEFLFKDMLRKKGLSDLFNIESRATYPDELGCPPHHGTRRKLAEHGIDCSGKRAELLTKADAAFDYIVGMDSRNIARINTILGAAASGKVYMLMDFTERPGDVADPWFTGDFDTTYNDIYEGCKRLLEFIAEKHLKK